MYAIRGSYPRGYDGYECTVFAVSLSIDELRTLGKPMTEGHKNRPGSRGIGQSYCGLDIVELPTGAFDLDECEAIETLDADWI